MEVIIKKDMIIRDNERWAMIPKGKKLQVIATEDGEMLLLYCDGLRIQVFKEDVDKLE